MNGLAALNPTELLLVAALVALMGAEVAQGLRTRSWTGLYRPTLFVAAILLYYVVIGPIRALGIPDGTVYRGLEHRGLLIWGWAGALVSYASLLFGFYAAYPRRPPRRLILSAEPERLHRLGLRLCQVGLVMFTLVTGSRVLALINPFAARELTDGGFGEQLADVGALANYFNYAVNLLIPGLCLMMAAWLRQRRHGTALLLWLLAAVGIYVSLGFRYRLVLLVIPLILLWFMARRRRPSLRWLALFVAGFILLNGIIGLTRSYGRGLDLERIEGLQTGELFDAGFGEAAVFFTTAGVIEQAATDVPYFVGIEPLVNTLFFPIPRTLFPGKPRGDYNFIHHFLLYGRKHYRGAAFLNYAEYYIMYGWWSVVALSALLGHLLRRLWVWFLWRQDEPLAQVIYLLTASYLYVVISRGYLAQVVMLFSFTVLPLFLLYRHYARRLPAAPGW